MRARAVVFWLVAAALLVPAVLVTLARLGEPSGGWWIGLVAFTPLGIVLYAATLLPAAARLLLRRRWRSPAAGLALVAALGLALHSWWFAPFVTGANPPPARAPRRCG